MPGKRFREAWSKRPTDAVGLHDAVTFVKDSAKAKFDETIEVHVHLGVDPKQSDQSVRGTVSLPHGSPSSVRVAVFTDDAKLQEAARAAGADIVGGKELIDKVSADKRLDADIAATTPDMMKDLSKIAKVLGPRGLMPNPKSGTIGADPAAIVKSLKGGRMNFKMDDSSNVHVAVAKASWETDKIESNARALVDAVRQAKPATAKGEYIRSVTLVSTMGPSVRVRI